MLLVLLSGCAALVQGGIGSSVSPISPPQGNVDLQFDAGFSPAEVDDVVDDGIVGFGLSARSRVDDKGQMNDFGVHLFTTLRMDQSVRPYARATVFALAQYDPELVLVGPGIGGRLEGGLLFCPGDDDAFYCASAQVGAEYDGWFGGTRPPFWVSGTLGIALNWGEGF